MNQSDQENEEMHSYFDNQSPGLFNDEDLTPMCQPRQQQKQHSDNSSLLSRIRQNFSVSHFLGYHNRAPGDGSDDEIVSTPVSSEESSTSTRRFSSIKNVFNSSHSDAHSRSNTSNSTCSVSSASSHSASKKQSSLYACSTQTSLPETLGTFSSQLDSPALTMSSLPDDTPPVTPCLPAGEASHSDIVVDPDNEHKREASIEIRDDEYRHDESKKGKEPAPPFPYETLITDISSIVKTQIPEIPEQDDDSEWWGLEYMIELSRKDSRASDASEETGGEHSKSRESWAAIHQGTVPPVCEDTNFHEWQKWHRSLDKMELKKRKRRTIEFFEESGRQANVFVYEMQARRALELYEDRLTDEEIYDVLLWIEYTSEQRQDPFDPAEAHGLGWVLKNHRSLASLREFAVPPLT